MDPQPRILYRNMAYSMHGHISYILEANSKGPNDFSLIGRKPSEILQFKRKRWVRKFKPKLNSKLVLKGSKTVKIMKIMKGSKKRRGLTQVKAM